MAVVDDVVCAAVEKAFLTADIVGDAQVLLVTVTMAQCVIKLNSYHLHLCLSYGDM